MHNIKNIYKDNRRKLNDDNFRIKVGLGITSISNGNIDGIPQYTSSILKLKDSQDKLNIVPISFGPHDKKLKPFFCPKTYSVRLIGQVLSMGKLKWFEDIPKDLSLFHATDNRIPVGLNIPVLATIHDVFPFTRPDLMKPSFNILGKQFLQHALQKANHVITVSEYSKTEIQKHFNFEESDITVIPNGIQNFWFAKANNSEKERTIRAHSIDKPFLLVVGTVQPRKNYKKIIEAYGCLSTYWKQRVNLVIVGKNGWGVNLKKIIKRNKLEKNIIWLTDVSNAELSILYQSASGLVFTSLAEGFGYPIIEAMASKCPVITSCVTSMPEIAASNALLVNPYSSEEITAAITNTLQHGKNINQNIKSGFKHANNFTEDLMLEKTYKTYLKILNSEKK